MKSALINLVQSIAPRSVSSWIREKQVPHISLSRRHVDDCEVLLDRSELLNKLSDDAVVAELGVDRGDFSAEILRATTPERLHLIDIWDSKRYHKGLYESVLERFAAEIDAGQIVVHRSLSAEAAKQFSDGYFDWIYIDTDHSYETTKQELHRYAPKVKEDGIIAGHDYSMGNWSKSLRYGVVEAVHEFCVQQEWELAYVTLEPKEKESFAIQRRK